MDNITFHDDLHGFLPDHGTGKACLEAKLEAQLAIITGRPLHHIYLDFARSARSHCYETMAWAPMCCVSLLTFGTATPWCHANRQSLGNLSQHGEDSRLVTYRHQYSSTS